MFLQTTIVIIGAEDSPIFGCGCRKKATFIRCNECAKRYNAQYLTFAQYELFQQMAQTDPLLFILAHCLGGIVEVPLDLRIISVPQPYIFAQPEGGGTALRRIFPRRSGISNVCSTWYLC